MAGLRFGSLNKLECEVLTVKDLDCSRESKGESSRRWGQLVRGTDSLVSFRPL